ncbi:MAG: flagellar basal body rod C-terminal domain-containing protein [Acidobacteriota bacterium]|nr:flagellar basal body rod C-terminal domain-containing protein [Acidobacteriota bacterium]
MIPVRAVEQDNGQVSVFLEGSGDTLLAGTSAHPLEIGRDADGLARILVDRSGERVDLTDTLRGGALGGYLAARDEHLTSYREQLDLLAATLIEEFNAVHRGAYDQAGDTGRNLFEPDPPGDNAAAAIRVNAEILDDPTKLGTADAAGEPGNNVAVLAMLDLRTAGISGLSGLTFTGYAADVIANVGRDLAAADAATEASEVIVGSLELKRQSVSAVSLDEEAANLARWQQSFEAAARFLQTVNRVTETALNLIPG